MSEGGVIQDTSPRHLTSILRPVGCTLHCNWQRLKASVMEQRKKSLGQAEDIGSRHQSGTKGEAKGPRPAEKEVLQDLQAPTTMEWLAQWEVRWKGYLGITPGTLAKLMIPPSKGRANDQREQGRPARQWPCGSMESQVKVLEGKVLSIIEQPAVEELTVAQPRRIG